MAELADALDLGSSPHCGLGVRLPSLAPELKRSQEVTETTSIKIEELNQVKRKLSFEIPWEEVKREVDSAYQKVGKKARIKGFRPGKTPRKLLETYFKDEAENEAISSIVNKAYWDAVERNKLEPAASPVIDHKGIEHEKDFTFSATIEIRPQVEPKDYLGLDIEVASSETTEVDVNKRLEELRQVYSTLEDIKEDRGILEGDFVTLDFEGFLEGNPVKDLKGLDVLIEAGARKFIPGFEENLIKMKIGESSKFNLKMPDEFQVKDAAGKDIEFSVTVKGIKVKKMPELDEEFIKNFEKYENVGQLRDDVRKSLEDEERERVKAATRKKIVDKLLELNTFEVPESYVERQINLMLLNMQRKMMTNGIDPKKAAEMLAGLRENFRPRPSVQ